MPRLPKQFVNDPAVLGCLSNKTSIDLLKEEKQSGVLICNGDNMQQQTSGGESCQRACIFIPSPDFDKIVLMKIVHPQKCLSDMRMTIYKSLASQLHVLDNNLENGLKGEVIPVIILLIIVMKEVAKEKIESEASSHSNIINWIRKEVLQFAIRHFANISVDLKHVCKNKKTLGIGIIAEKKKFQEILSCGTGLASKYECQILLNFVKRFDREITLEISTKRFKNLGGGDICLSQFHEVIYMFKLYFPGKDSALETLPDFLKIRDNLLDRTDGHGCLRDNYESFIGEIRDFWVNFVAKIPDPIGLLIKSYTDSKINSILDQVTFNCRFEIDWLYCGDELILAFEIGRTNNPTNPLCTIYNKFEQVLNKLMPTMFLVLTVLHKSIQKFSLVTETNQNFWLFVYKTFKFVLFLPNISSDVFTQIVSDLKNKEKLKKFPILNRLKNVISKAASEKLENLLILTLDDPYTPNCRTKNFKIDQNLNLEESQKTVQDLIKHGHFNRQTNEQNSVIQYISGLLAFSCLIEKDLLPSEKENWARNYVTPVPTFYEQKLNAITKTEDSKKELLDVILSPQQHRILQENRRRVLIVGEPGSGKSALLLARAKQAAQDNKIQHILFSTPAGKTEYRELVHSYVNKPGNELLKSKFCFISVEDLADSSKFGKNWLVDK